MVCGGGGGGGEFIVQWKERGIYVVSAQFRPWLPSVNFSSPRGQCKISIRIGEPWRHVVVVEQYVNKARYVGGKSNEINKRELWFSRRACYVSVFISISFFSSPFHRDVKFLDQESSFVSGLHFTLVLSCYHDMGAHKQRQGKAIVPFLVFKYK